MRYRLSYLDEIFELDVHKEKDEFVVTVNDKEYRVKDITVYSNHAFMKIQDKKYTIFVAQDGDRRYVSHDGEYYIVDIARSAKSGLGAAEQKTNSVASSMPGLLVKMPVTVGEDVSAGQTLAIVEAMKMQTELHAPCSGVVKKVNFKEGEQVDAFQPIVELEPKDE
jgi:biotin carboxyl carrier protein